MIVEVGEKIKGYLDDFRIGGSGTNQFIDKLAGVVQVISKSDKNGDVTVKKYFPVACGMTYTECINSGKYKDLVPNSKLGFIFYLEEISLQFAGRNGRKYKWIARYKGVGWINKKKLGKSTSCSVSSQIITTLMTAFPEFPENNGNFQGLHIQIVGQDPKTSNPFAKYSYDESVNQFLMAPFEYFSLPIEASFETDPACFEPFELDVEEDC